MKQKEPRSIFIIFYFFSLPFFLLPSSFLFLFSFPLIILLLFCSFAPQNFCNIIFTLAFVRDDVMTPPPCLNDARPRA
jgi:hypothetical protein